MLRTSRRLFYQNYAETLCEVGGCGHLQVSLWWRWLAAEVGGEKVPQLLAGERPEWESGPGSGLESGSQSPQEKAGQRCGSQRYSGLRRHLRWLPEEVAGLTWLSVSGKRIQHMEES